MPNKLNLKTQGGISGGFRGSQLQKSGLSKGWTDWHQIWYTSADSSGNGHRLNTICPSTCGRGGGVRGSQIQKSGEDSNVWSDWHQIWYTCVNSSGNGYTPNKLHRETQGAFGGF